jgi:hypothetical protein
MRTMRKTLRMLLSASWLLGCGGGEGSKEDEAAKPPMAGELLDASCPAAVGEEEHFPDAGSAHVSRVEDFKLTYTDPPPTGGTHSECWANFGVYAEELEDARWVHNLEHGGIVLLYRCPEGCPEEVAQLEKFVADHPRTILTPYAALPTRFAAVAWEYRLLNPCLDLPSIERFYADHFNRAREDIAGGPPALCAEIEE